MAIVNFNAPDNLAYKGKEANEIMAKPIYESDLYSYGITYRPGVKGKEQLIMGEVSELFQMYTCAFSPSGEVNLSEQWIEPFTMKINLQECYDAFWPSFMAEETRRAYVGENIPRTFFEWFFNDMLIKQMKREYEEIFWNGDTESGSGILKLGNGIVKQLANTEVKKVTGAVLTVDNILDQITAVAALADINVDDAEYKIFINKGQMKILKTALGNEKIFNNYVWNNFTKEGEKVYAYGFEVVPTRIAKDVILLAPNKNLILGYDLESDQTSFQILDLSQVTGDNEFRVIAMCNMAVGLVYPELMVISKPA
jgi:hypothetical protein